MPRGPKPPFAGRAASGWRLEPPVSRDDAAAAYGHKISAEVWEGIREAFLFLGSAQDDLASLRNNANKNDPKSYSILRDQAERKIDDAFHAAEGVRSDHELCRQISENFTLGKLGIAESYRLEDALKGAVEYLEQALMILREADPVDTAHPSDSDARKRAIRTVAAKLEEHGLPARPHGSPFWQTRGGGADWDDLSDFGRLVRCLGLMVAASALALEKQIKRALKE